MPETRARRPGELAFVTLMLAVALFLFWQAYRISGFSALSAPGAFPLAATGSMVVAGAVALARTLALPNGETGFLAFRRQILPNVVGLLTGLILLYGAVLDRLGFVIASFGFLFCGVWLLHRKGPRNAAFHALVSVVVIYVIFRLIFSVLLPEGFLPERRWLAILTDLLMGRAR